MRFLGRILLKDEHVPGDAVNGDPGVGVTPAGGARGKLARAAKHKPFQPEDCKGFLKNISTIDYIRNRLSLINI